MKHPRTRAVWALAFAAPMLFVCTHTIRDIAEGPVAALYFLTSNRDGRGSPAKDDDRIMRLVPQR